MCSAGSLHQLPLSSGLLSVSKGGDCRGGLRGSQQNMHQLSRCIFNMPVHQNVQIGEFSGQLYCFSFILGLSGCNWVSVICSPDFIRPWV